MSDIAAEQVAPLTEAWVDLLDHALAEDGCHGFYDDHVNTNRAVMQIVAQAKAEAVALVRTEGDRYDQPNQWVARDLLYSVARKIEGSIRSGEPQ